MRDEVYNVKLPAEIKQKWQELIERITQEQDLKKYGDAYPYIMQLIEASITETAPELTSYIHTIFSNLQSVQSSVIAINNAYQSLVQSQDQKFKEAQEGLSEQINQLSIENKELRNKKREQDEIKKQKENEIQTLTQQNMDLEQRIKHYESEERSITGLYEEIKQSQQNYRREVEHNQALQVKLDNQRKKYDEQISSLNLEKMKIQEERDSLSDQIKELEGIRYTQEQDLEYFKKTINVLIQGLLPKEMDERRENWMDNQIAISDLNSSSETENK